jgi:hypothetical protein
MSFMAWEGTETARSLKAFQDWEREFLAKERAWEQKKKARNWSLFGVGMLPYVAGLIVVAAIWCATH